LVKWLFYEAFVVPPLTVKATTSPKARRGHLTTDEAARRLDLSPARVQELARAGEIRGKIDGRWTFTEREIARMQGERDRRARRLSLTSTRPQKRTTRRRRSSSDSGSGRLTRADTQALGYLDQLLAEERRLEQTCRVSRINRGLRIKNDTDAAPREHTNVPSHAYHRSNTVL